MADFSLWIFSGGAFRSLDQATTEKAVALVSKHSTHPYSTKELSDLAGKSVPRLGRDGLRPRSGRVVQEELKNADLAVRQPAGKNSRGAAEPSRFVSSLVNAVGTACIVYSPDGRGRPKGCWDEAGKNSLAQCVLRSSIILLLARAGCGIWYCRNEARIDSWSLFGPVHLAAQPVRAFAARAATNDGGEAFPKYKLPPYVRSSS